MQLFDFKITLWQI